MNRLMVKFADACADGTIEDMRPIPNRMFSFEELEYLYNQGCIYEDGNRFIASIPSSLE